MARAAARARSLVRRRPVIAFLTCVPLLAIIGSLVGYPFFYAIYLSTLDKAETRMVGLGNYLQGPTGALS